MKPMEIEQASMAIIERELQVTRRSSPLSSV